MARFDVHPNPERTPEVPFVLDVQADLLDGVTTRVVLPLYRLHLYPRPARRLNPVLEVLGEPLVLLAHLPATLPAKALPPPVANLSAEHGRIVDALDMLFQGF